MIGFFRSAEANEKAKEEISGQQLFVRIIGYCLAAFITWNIATSIPEYDRSGFFPGVDFYLEAGAWLIPMLGVSIVFINHVIDKYYDNRRARLVEAAEQEFYKNEYHAEIERLCAKSCDKFSDIPQHLDSANNLLDQAQERFEDGAYSPFWESIERALTELGSFNAAIRTIHNSASSYRSNLESYRQNGGSSDNVPGFPISSADLEQANACELIATRLNDIAYEALKHHDFTVIYEQRRTSAILVEGFKTLGQAIDQLGNRIGHELEMTQLSLAQELGKQSRVQERQLRTAEDTVKELRRINNRQSFSN